MLDIRTLLFNLLLFALVFSLGLLFVQRGQAMARGLRCWALANALAGLAFLLTGLRGFIWDFLSIVVANTLLLLALFAFHTGIARMRGIPGQARGLMVMLLGILVPLLFYYTYLAPSVAARTVAMVLTNAPPAILTIALLLRDVPRRLRASHWFTAAAFGQYLLFACARLVDTLLHPPTELMSGGLLQGLGFVSIFLLLVMSSFGCVWMVTDYLAEELERRARTDPLTGAGNRLALEENLTREIERARRGGRPLSVVIFDLDHFKQLNDSLGHQCGDEALASVADIAQRALRAGDLLARYGGEEFLVLLPDTPSRSAIDTAQRLRRRVEEASISCGEGARLTASFGVASFPADGDTAQALIRHADLMLYRAKRAGRNCVLPAPHASPISRGA